MTAPLAVVDTNVLVSALLTQHEDAPTRVLLGAMLAADVPYLVSTALLAEYRGVLRRPELRRLHRLTDDDIDTFLTDLTLNAIVREPEPSATTPPDRRDQHLWDLLESDGTIVLVTGDEALRRAFRDPERVVSPRQFVTLLERRRRD